MKKSTAKKVSFIEIDSLYNRLLSLLSNDSWTLLQGLSRLEKDIYKYNINSQDSGKFLTIVLRLLFVDEVELEKGEIYEGLNDRMLTPLVSTILSMKAPAAAALFSIHEDKNTQKRYFKKNVQEFLCCRMRVMFSVFFLVLDPCFGSLIMKKVGCMIDEQMCRMYLIRRSSSDELVRQRCLVLGTDDLLGWMPCNDQLHQSVINGSKITDRLMCFGLI